MKCPKCSYLGFETGDTCKNCGYDFSLLADIDPLPADDEPIIDLDLRTVDESLTPAPDWPEIADVALHEPEPLSGIEDDLLEEVSAPRSAHARAIAAVVAEPPLPLFTQAPGDEDDEPLIKLPTAPRAPIAVRRTPEIPRLRVVPRTVRAAEAAPALAFEAPEPGPEPEPVTLPGPLPPAEVPRPVSHVWDARPDAAVVSAPGVRLVAAAIDHVVLGAVDVSVVYLTTRIAGLAMGDWVMLPPVPMIAFLLMVKFAYFAAFTAVGGQTIGKMALRLRVVAADRAPIDAGLAVKRTLAGALSAVTLGLGFAPAFFDSERRTLHDRLARTRVVSFPPA